MASPRGGGGHSPDVEVGLHALLLVGKLEAGHLDDVEESLAHHPRGCVVHPPQALLQPAAGHSRGEGGRRRWDPHPGMEGCSGHGRARSCSPAVAVAVADGVPAQVAVPVAGGEGVDDVLAVVMVPAAPVRVPVFPCREGTGCRQGWGGGTCMGWG